MTKKEYIDFKKRYSLLNSVDTSPDLNTMIELQNAVFLFANTKNLENIWEERITSKIKRQQEFARFKKIPAQK